MADPSKLHPADEVTPEGRRQFLRCAAVTGASALVPASLLSACAAAMSFQGVVADGRVRQMGVIECMWNDGDRKDFVGKDLCHC